jgi:hypothetical protein
MQPIIGRHPFLVKDIDVTFPPWLKHESVQIARDFLERSGEIDDPYTTELLLADTVEFLMSQGISSRLLLSNLAIAAYQKYRQSRTIDLGASEKAS